MTSKTPRRGYRRCESCGWYMTANHFRKSTRWVNRTCKECEDKPGRGARG